jgi:hypothetical protein
VIYRQVNSIEVESTVVLPKGGKKLGRREEKGKVDQWVLSYTLIGASCFCTLLHGRVAALYFKKLEERMLNVIPINK